MSWSRNTVWQQGSVLTQQDFLKVGLKNESNADLDEEAIVVELIASRKISIQKDILEQIQPDRSYQLDSRFILQSWLAARYRRHALPNS